MSSRLFQPPACAAAKSQTRVLDKIRSRYRSTSHLSSFDVSRFDISNSVKRFTCSKCIIIIIMNITKTVGAVSGRAQRFPFSPCQMTLLLFPQHLHSAKSFTRTLYYCRLPIRTFARAQSQDSSIRKHNLSSASQAHPLRRTALHDLHVAHKAKLVPFGGYSMPVQYADQTVSESHNWTREKASLFDVGHMYAAAFSAFINPVEERLNP